MMIIPLRTILDDTAPTVTKLPVTCAVERPLMLEQPATSIRFSFALTNQPSNWDLQYFKSDNGDASRRCLQPKHIFTLCVRHLRFSFMLQAGWLPSPLR